MAAEYEIVERLNEEASRLSGHSLDRGCASSGVASNIASEAAATIVALAEALKEARGMLRSRGFDTSDSDVDPELQASWDRGLAKIDSALARLKGDSA